MLHPRLPPPFGHRLVERVGGGVRPEAFAVAGAETLDRLLVQQRLAGGQQRELGDVAGGALVGGVEGPHRLDLIAEQIDAQRLVG